jgi:MFS family permease
MGPANRNRWALVTLLSVAATVAYMDRLILSVLFVPLSHDMSLTDTQMSVLQGGSFAVVYALAGLPLGLLADRLNRRNVILASVLVWCSATVACGFATSFSQLVIARACVGIGEAALFPAATSMVGDSVTLQRRGLALGVFIMGQVLGGGAAVGAGGILLDFAQHHSFSAFDVLRDLAPWRVVLLMIGLLGLPILLGMIFVREPDRRELAADRIVGLKSVLAHLAFHRRTLLPLLLALACAAISDFSIGAWTPTLLTRKFGWSGAQIGFWFGGCLIVSGLIAAPIAGLLSDWVRAQAGSRGVIAWALVAAVGACLCTAFALASNTQVLLGVLFAQSIASAICSLICFMAIQVSLPNELRGLGSALVSLGNILFGLGCGPTLVALSTQHLYRDPGAVGLSITTVTAPAFAVCALLLVMAQRGEVAGVRLPLRAGAPQ